jgi:hypothetical protein
MSQLIDAKGQQMAIFMSVETRARLAGRKNRG